MQITACSDLDSFSGGQKEGSESVAFLSHLSMDQQLVKQTSAYSVRTERQTWGLARIVRPYSTHNTEAQ